MMTMLQWFIFSALVLLLKFFASCSFYCVPDFISPLTEKQEGATKEEIDQLPKYKFHRKGNFENVNGEIQASFGGTMAECEIDMPTERLLSHEDAVSIPEMGSCLYHF